MTGVDLLQRLTLEDLDEFIYRSIILLSWYGLESDDDLRLLAEVESRILADELPIAA